LTIITSVVFNHDISTDPQCKHYVDQQTCLKNAAGVQAAAGAGALQAFLAAQGQQVA
jgi:hypothetical protein